MARNYRHEYQRRIARNLAQGRTRAAARGHAKSGEGVRDKRRFALPPTDLLHLAFGRIKSGESLTKTAKALRISRERLRRYVGENAEIRRRGRRLEIVQDRRRFQLPLYSKGRLQKAIVDADGATELGRYMAAVGRFLETNKVSYLEPFVGRGIVNAFGQFIPFETGPNALYALDAKGELTFHQIYQIQL